MLLAEANTWLKEPITEEELQAITPLYYLLDLATKEDFCKVLEAVEDIEEFITKEKRYKRFIKAEKELTRKEQHQKDLERLEAIYDERVEIEKRVKQYREANNN